jgi:hypothetical protein
MIKLKSILNEGYSWERKADGSLPTLSDSIAAYEAKLREEAKPDYIDADGDGNEKESMKQAFADKEDSSFSEYSLDALTDMKINLSRYEGNEEEIKKINAEIAKRKNNESINELSDDEIDARWNKPQQNWQRQFNSSQMDVKSVDMPKSSNGGVSKFYQEKLAALEAERQQIEFDMEQEAEPEGGPIADYYGGALENIDNQISAVRSKMNKNESTFTTKAGLQEMREIPLEQRILRNLKGNDYILRETFKK